MQLKKIPRLTLGMTILIFTSFSAHAMGLRESSIIEGHSITLGDLFYDLPRDEERILGSAPRPGKEMVLNARTLMKIAMALDLPWRPSHAAEKIVLRRAASVVEYDQIKEVIHTALYDEGMLGDYEISIPAEFQQIILPADYPPSAVVTSIDIDRAAQVFDVTLAAPSAQNPIQHLRIRGRMDAVVSVPVLNDNLQHGRVITEDDIQVVTIKERQFNERMIADPRDLIGMTARRVIVAGRPVQRNDLVAPLVVSRGELVTLFLSQGGMRLTTQVKAMQDGAKGDIIRVVNMNSNQALQAVITGTRAVAVVEN